MWVRIHLRTVKTQMKRIMLVINIYIYNKKGLQIKDIYYSRRPYIYIQWTVPGLLYLADGGGH